MAKTAPSPLFLSVQYFLTRNFQMGLSENTTASIVDPVWFIPNPETATLFFTVQDPTHIIQAYLEII